MALRLLVWFVSLGAHGTFALFLLLPAGGTALHDGAGEEMMVVQQGIAIEGFAKLGEDQVSIEPIEAPPVQMAAAQPLPEEVKPIEEQDVVPLEERPEEVKPIEEQPVIASAAGPEQENVKDPEPEEVETPEPEPEEVVEPKPEAVEQALPPQVAAVAQESVAAQRQSSSLEKKGGDTTAHSAYLGTLRSHLERNKVNPRSGFVGTAVVRFKVSSNGEVISREIVTSSGNKVLDEAALASIEKASPFPAMPEGLQREQIEVSVPFRFRVR